MTKPVAYSTYSRDLLKIALSTERIDP
jgi:hypothetical protein